MATRLVVLASGRGSDFQAIADHVSLDILRNVSIAGVICNHEGAPVIERARGLGIPCKVIQGISGRKFATSQEREDARALFDNDCLRVVSDFGADLVALAGFDQILSEAAISSFSLRILNIHPAIDLKRFGGRSMIGRRIHELVLKSGEKYSGCTIHFVTNDVDGGPIVLKRKVLICDNDSPESLEQRILAQEHQAYPEAIQLIADGRVSVDVSVGKCFVDRYSDGWDIEWDLRQRKYITLQNTQE